MEQSNCLYDLKADEKYKKPYIDIDEWREGTVRYHYIHGGFEGTTLLFSFFFPDKKDYKGRFFQFLSPVPNSEDASVGRKGAEDKITFAITHGAYFIETNMGGFDSEPVMKYQGSAQAAKYSREIARQLFGEHRPYGYVYGGSGGGYKTMSCIENTNEVWDGAVPYIIGMPYSMPNDMTIRAHAMRILKDKLPQIIDAMEPGGSGDIYAGLNEEEREALEEATRMGFPKKSWFAHEYMGSGSLPVLAPHIGHMVPQYYEDFWTVPGYLGADPNSSAARARVQFKTVAVAIELKRNQDEENLKHKTGADDAWHKLLGMDGYEPYIELEEIPEHLDYLEGMNIIVMTGEAAGFRMPLKSLNGKKAYIGSELGLQGIIEALQKMKPKDEIMLDNSNYIAVQTFHRHQVPEDDYPAWDMFKDENGNPLYPQVPFQLGPALSYGGAGSVQSGNFKGKMIVIAALMDESAFPWQADWYRTKIKKQKGGREEEYFRLWYMENSLHDDSEKTVDDLHLISYLGGLHQALLDLSNWVEKGITPPDTTIYTIEDNEVFVPAKASQRKGIQPVVDLKVNGVKYIKVKVGEKVHFTAEVEVPHNAGKLTTAEWSFEGEVDYPIKGTFNMLSEEEREAIVEAEHIYEKPGTYFAVLRVKSNRIGLADDIFTQVPNLSRVRVIVEG